MMKMRHALSVFAALAIASWVPLALAQSGETFRFGIDRTPPPAADAPRRVDLGMATLNGRIRLPAHALDVVHGADGRTGDRPESLAFTAKLNAKHAAQLALWYTPGGWLLVPRGWRPLHGGVGANGSVSLLFVAPDGDGYLSYYDPSACVGCAQHAASAFFAEARQDARDNEFPYYERTDPPVRMTRLRPNVIAYRATLGAQRIDGIAWYDGKEDLPFFKLEVALPPSQSSLATAILNWRLPPRR